MKMKANLMKEKKMKILNIPLKTKKKRIKGSHLVDKMLSLNTKKNLEFRLSRRS
jgi:hypothetical protein